MTQFLPAALTILTRSLATSMCLTILHCVSRAATTHRALLAKRRRSSGYICRRRGRKHILAVICWSIFLACKPIKETHLLTVAIYAATLAILAILASLLVVLAVTVCASASTNTNRSRRNLCKSTYAAGPTCQYIIS